MAYFRSDADLAISGEGSPLYPGLETQGLKQGDRVPLDWEPFPEPDPASVLRVACVYLAPTGQLKTERSFEALAEACLQFSPQIAIRPEEAIFMEVGRCRNLYTESGLSLRLHSLARRFGRQVKVAFAADAATALSVARYGSNRLPLDALIDYASPFFADLDQQKRIWKTIRALQSLGLKSAQEFIELPARELASRFGKEAVDLHGRIRGNLEAAWPGFRPVEKVIERTEVADPVGELACEGLEALLFVLRGLADRSMARLRGRGARASQVKVTFELEKWSSVRRPQREWVIQLPLPQGSASSLLPILQERISFELGRDSLEAPVRAISFEVVESVPGAGAQKDFFSRTEEEGEAWSALIARLSQKIGPERVFLAEPVQRYLPEAAYLRAMKGLGAVRRQDLFWLLKFPKRPTRVLRKAERLQRSGTWLVHPGGRSWKVRGWEGPERISGEWWRDAAGDGFSRDYYRVVAESGELLWVYMNRELAEPQLYLHGFFD